MALWILFHLYYVAVAYIFIFLKREEKDTVREELMRRIPYFVMAFFLVTIIGLVSVNNTIPVATCSFFVSNVCLIYFLVLIRKIVAPTNWFLIPFIPVTGFFILYLAANNIPSYNGALAGIGMPREFTANFFVFFAYPIFVFLLNMLRMNKIAKGIVLLAISIISGILGICYSYGIDGFLADHDMKISFVAIILILTVWGILYLIPSRFLQKELVHEP